MDSTAKRPSLAIGRSNIDDFVATLSPWDVLYLRDKFRSGSIPITGLAGLPDLPAEILSLIVTQLTLDDIVNCRLVSRGWYSSWTQGAVIKTLGHFFFPGLIEKHQQRNSPQSPQRLVQASVAKAFRRRHARPSRTSFILWREPCCPVFKRPGGEAEETLDCHRTSYHSPGPPVFYDRGRLAWQASELKIIVDDLRTCERRECSLIERHLHGQRLGLQGMSREMLVFVVKELSGSNYDTIHIWHTDLQDWRRVTLPGPFVGCFVEGERVAFITRQRLLITWSWVGGATEVDIPGEMSRPPEGYEARSSLPGVILHPGKPDTLFVAFMFGSKLNLDGVHGIRRCWKRRFLMSVVRYEDGKPIKRWQELIREDSLSNTYHESIHIPFRVALLCSEMSPNGLYNLGTVLTANDEYDSVRVVELATVAFNIYKESFVQREFLESDGNGIINQVQLRFEPSLWGLCDHQDLLTTWSEEHALIPRWVHLDSADRRLDRGKAAAAAAADDVVLYLRELDKCVPVSEPCRIFGDEDFQIHVTTHGVLVWSFTDETSLPVVDGPWSLEGGKNEPTRFVRPASAIDLRPTWWRFRQVTVQ